MVKLLLTFLAVITVVTTAAAQKATLALNYPTKTPVAVADSAASKPLAIVVKPAAPALKYTDTETDTELTLVEETARLRLQGRQDAKQHYKAKGVFWGTMGTTLLYPAAGLATGTIVSVIPPSTESADNPNAHLMKEPAYEEAFKKQAHRKRFGNAAAGFGVGVAVLGIVTKVLAGGL